MLLFLKILSEIANSVDFDQTAPESDLGLHCLHICHFVRKFGVQNLRTDAVVPLDKSKPARLVVNHVDPDWMPYSAVADVDLHCLLMPVHPNTYL